MMKLSKQSVLLNFVLFSLIVMSSSCSVSVVKRRYRPGYHIDVVQPAENDHRAAITKSAPVGIATDRTEMISIADSTSKRAEHAPLTIVERLPEVSQLPQKKNIKKQHILGDDTCDVVNLVTGEKIKAIVVEIGANYVHYKKCSDTRGRLYTVKTRMINNITFRNGEYFIPEDRIIVDREKEKKKSKTLFIMAIVAASIALVCLLLSFFIAPAGVVSLIFSFLDLFYTLTLMFVNIRPTRYASSDKTKFTWILCIIAIAVIIAALVIVFI